MRSEILGYGEGSHSQELVRHIQAYVWNLMIPKTKKAWEERQATLEWVKESRRRIERLGKETYEEVYGRPYKSPRQMMEELFPGRPFELRPHPNSDDPHDWEYRLWTGNHLIRKVERWK